MKEQVKYYQIGWYPDDSECLKKITVPTVVRPFKASKSLSVETFHASNFRMQR